MIKRTIWFHHASTLERLATSILCFSISSLKNGVTIEVRLVRRGILFYSNYAVFLEVKRPSDLAPSSHKEEPTIRNFFYKTWNRFSLFIVTRLSVTERKTFDQENRLFEVEIPSLKKMKWRHTCTSENSLSQFPNTQASSQIQKGAAHM